MKIKRGNKCSAESAAKPKSKWPLLQQLTFLEGVSFESSTHGNMLELLQDPLQSNSDAESSLTETPIDTLVETLTNPQTPTDAQENISVSKKRTLYQLNYTTKKIKCDTNKILEILEKKAVKREKLTENTNDMITEEADPIFTFFRSMAMTVKTFETDLIVEAKFKLFNIIHELEIRSLQRKCCN